MTYLRVPGSDEVYAFGQLDPEAERFHPQVVDLGPSPVPGPVVEGPGTGAEGMMAQALSPEATPFQPQVVGLQGMGGLGVQLSPVGPSMPQVVPLGEYGEQLDPQAEPFRPQVVQLSGYGEQLDSGASPYVPQYVQLSGLGADVTPVRPAMSRRPVRPSAAPQIYTIARGSSIAVITASGELRAVLAAPARVMAEPTPGGLVYQAVDPLQVVYQTSTAMPVGTRFRKVR